MSRETYYDNRQAEEMNRWNDATVECLRRENARLKSECAEIAAENQALLARLREAGLL